MNWKAIMNGEAEQPYEQNPHNPQNRVQKGNIANIANIALEDDRWNPELAAQGYHWCYDCRYFNQTCTHPDNPFRKQCPQAPRKCQWYEDNHLEYT